MSARMPTGNIAANSDTNRPVMMVTHVRGVELRMDVGQLPGQQAVARHGEEDAGLAVHHHQDDRRQREVGRHADHVASAREADHAQHVGQWLLAANERLLPLQAAASSGVAPRCRRHRCAPSASAARQPRRRRRSRRAGRTPCTSQASRSSRSGCCVADSWSLLPRSIPHRSRRRRRRSRLRHRARRCRASGLPQPFGKNGSKLASCDSWNGDDDEGGQRDRS